MPPGVGGEPQFSLLVHDCAGTVRLVGCHQTPNGSTIYSPTFAHIVRCVDVTIDNCTLAEVVVRDSVVRFHGCVLMGDEFPRQGGTAFSALSAERAQVVVSRTNFLGSSSVVPPFPPVVKLDASRFWFDSQNISPNGCLTAIDAVGGEIHLGPQAILRNHCGGPTITGTATVYRHDWPRVWAGTEQIGLAYSPASGWDMLFRVEDRVGATAYLFVGLSGREIPFPPLGGVWIEPALLFNVGFGTIPSSGALEWRARMGYPAFPAGAALTFQAISFFNGEPRLSLPVQIVQLLIY